MSVGAVREVEEEILRRGVVVEAHEAVAHFQIVDDDATTTCRLVVVPRHDLRERRACRRRERLRLGAEPPLGRCHWRGAFTLEALRLRGKRILGQICFLPMSGCAKH